MKRSAAMALASPALLATCATPTDKSVKAKPMSTKIPMAYEHALGAALGGADKLRFALTNGARLNVSTMLNLMQRGAAIEAKENAEIDHAHKQLMLMATKRHEDSANALEALGAVMATYGAAIREAGGGEMLDEATARLAVAQAPPVMRGVPGWVTPKDDPETPPGGPENGPSGDVTANP